MKQSFMSQSVTARYAAFGAVLTVLSGIDGAKESALETVMGRALPLIMLDQYVLGYNKMPEELEKISDGSQIPTSFILFASVDEGTHQELKTGRMKKIEPKHYMSGHNIWIVDGGGPKADLQKVLEAFAVDRGLDDVNFAPGFGKW
ncbi:toxin-activating lysine-acyltransferase [Litorimonas sp. WD9-15]|uniref:toxin-activating lysine-acyltransferase n=1 Tax=Litorimonas sp. WD9-15 TaxID=3418716 RepID=UPI003CFDEE72